MAETSNWESNGVCRQVDPELMFEPGKIQNTNKQVCAECPVQLQCLLTALEDEHEFGIWGGMTERERRKLQRQHGKHANWSEILAPVALPERQVA